MRKVIFLSLIFFCGSIYAKKLNIALFNLVAKGGVSGSVAAALSEEVRYEFIRTKKFQVIEKERMDQILREHAFQQAGCTDQECAVEAGRILNVEKMIVGSLSKLGKKYILYLRVVDIEKGNIEFEEKEQEVCEVEELTEFVRPLVNKITRLIHRDFGKGVGELLVMSKPIGVEVYLDGRYYGETDERGIKIPNLSTGIHNLRLKKEGYKDIERDVVIDAGLLTEKRLKLSTISEISEEKDGYLEGIMDSKRDGTAATSPLLWFGAGFGCSCLGVGAAYLMQPPSAPVEKLIGKSAPYALGYSEGYKQQAKKRRTQYAWGGLGAYAILVLYLSSIR